MNSTISPGPNEIDVYVDLGLRVLETVVARATREFSQTKIIGLSVDKRYDREYEEIFVGNGGEYFRKFYSFIDSTDGTNCAPLDSHWNHLGNKVAGEKLSELLSKIVQR